MVFILDGIYFYAPWGSTVDSKGCRSIYGLVSGAAAVVATQRSELNITGNKITLTISNYSDTSCTTLANTIVAQSKYTPISYVQTNIIYLDSDTSEYKKWSTQPINALRVDITYESANLTCNSSSCDLSTISRGCISGTLSNGGSVDYTSCQFGSQPKPLYTLAYKNDFNEIMFGTNRTLSSDSVSNYAGDSDANRHKYILANERYSVK